MRGARTRARSYMSRRDSEKKRMAFYPTRGGVEDARLEAKDTKKIRGQGQPFRGQTLSRPRTGMLEAKDQGHRGKRSQKKIKFSKNFFSRSPIHRRTQIF